MEARQRILAVLGLTAATVLLVILALASGVNLGSLTGVFSNPLGTTMPTAHPPSPRHSHATSAPRPAPPVVAPVATAPRPRSTPAPGALWTVAHALQFAAASSIVLAFALLALAMLLVKNRLDARERREYELYRIDLSMHDHASLRELKDLAEALTNLVRKRQVSRAIGGQPFFALELRYEQSDTSGGMEWSACLRCERSMVATVQSHFANAYPDVRLGWVQGHRTPQPMTSAATRREPGYVARYRKARSFVLPLTMRQEDDEAAPIMEAIAQTQVMVGVESIVRIQVTPTDQHFEGWARGRFRSYENRLSRNERGLSERQAGVRSAVNTAEMADAATHTQNAGLLWFEVQVATDTPGNADRIASAVTGRRGENRLYRRRMFLRQELYRRRFTAATPPLMPTFGWRHFNSLMSSAELAHLLGLPGARMKAVPVRRLTIPRLPPPPEVPRAPEWQPRVPDDDVIDGVLV